MPYKAPEVQGASQGLGEVGGRRCFRPLVSPSGSSPAPFRPGSQNSCCGPTSGRGASSSPLGRARGVSRSPEKAASRVTRALSPRRGQMRCLTSADRMKGTGEGKNKATANLLFWALCELAPFPASPR